MIAQALRDYHQEHARHTATGKHALYHEARLNAFFGDRNVDCISQGKINEYVRERQAKKESNGTIRRDLEVLKAALNHEERERRLTYVPKFKMPPPPAARHAALSDSEIERIKSACKSQHVKDFITLMYETGQRPGAIEQLQWFQVDFKKGLIGFDLTGKQQTNKRVRPVAMTSIARSVLKRLFKVKTTEYVLEYFDPITDTIKKAGCVKKAFQRACDDAGVKTFRYALRKTFANRDMDEGIKQQIMGHTNVKTTREHYIEANIAKQREAMEKPKNSPRGKKNVR